MQRQITLTWLVLVAATMGSWMLGFEHRAGPVALLILLIALVKCRIVMRSFMEVRRAPRWLQRACDVWLVLNLGLLGSSFWP